MIENTHIAVLWIGAIGSSLFSGVFFSLSTIILTALARIETSAGVVAMQSINDSVQRSGIVALYFVTSFAALAVIVGFALEGSQHIALWEVCIGAISVIGLLLCTAIFITPLNRELQEADPYSAYGAAVWDHYLHRWPYWNLVRVTASSISSIFFFASIYGELS